MVLKINHVYDVMDMYGMIIFPATLIGVYEKGGDPEGRLFVFEKTHSDRTGNSFKFCGAYITSRVTPLASGDAVTAEVYLRATHYGNSPDELSPGGQRSPNFRFVRGKL